MTTREERGTHAMTAEELPEGWTSLDAYLLYLDDPDGGRSPVRAGAGEDAR